MSLLRHSILRQSLLRHLLLRQSLLRQWPIAGVDPGGGAHQARAPLKLEKIWFFGVKSWFFTRNTPTIFPFPSAIGKNKIFWRKIVIFHTQYPQKKILSAPPPNFKSWIRPWIVFAILPLLAIQMQYGTAHLTWKGHGFYPGVGSFFRMQRYCF